MAGDYVGWMSALPPEPLSLLLYSPYQRTVETAALLAGVLHPGSEHEDPLLAPGSYPDVFSEQDYVGHDHIVMVSHQPFVSQAIAFWTDDMTLAPLAPGGYSSLEVTCLARGGAAVLRHCPDPRQLMGGNQI
jgi:phosphohistidine phosphatase SixA